MKINNDFVRNIAEKSDDNWLRDNIAEFIDSSEESSRLIIALGRLCWVGVLPEPEAWFWGSNLSVDERREVVEIAGNAIDRVATFLDELSGRSDESQMPEWQEDFLRACHMRDDVEGVLVLLRNSSELEEKVEVLDYIGKNLSSKALPRRDARLNRVAMPDMWWVAQVWLV